MVNRVQPTKVGFYPPSFSHSMTTTTTIRLRNSRQTPERRFSLSMGIVRVGGRYRIHKLLGTGGSGKALL